jgi:hypothetical protein
MSHRLQRRLPSSDPCFGLQLQLRPLLQLSDPPLPEPPWPCAPPLP